MVEKSKEISFHEKLMNVITALYVPKDKKNTFADFKYRDAESIMKAAKTPAFEQGLYINVTKEIVKIEERFYVKATATITDGENKEQSVAYAREPLNKPKMDESQVTGSASSYAKKYALADLLMIDDSEDDPDRGDNTKKQTQQQKGPEMITADQKSEISDLVNVLSKAVNKTPKDVYAAYSVTNLNGFTKSIAADFIAQLGNEINKHVPNKEK